MGLSAGVSSQLPKSQKKSIRKAQLWYLPPNPTTLAELTDLPEKYQKTLSGETLLVYDSRDNNDDVDERVMNDIYYDT